MAKLFTREQARTWLRENNLKDGKSIENAFIADIKDVLQEALEEEMNTEFYLQTITPRIGSRELKTG